MALLAPTKPLRLSPSLLRRWPLPMPSAESDKEGRGHVLVIAGSREVPGAAVLAAMAAMRVGAGKLTIAAPASVAGSVALSMPEARVVALQETRVGALSMRATATISGLSAEFDSVLCGPGMVAGPALRTALAEVRKRYPHAIIVADAAALETPDALKREGRESDRFIVTPHAGEMAKLVKSDKSAVEAEPAAYANRLATAHGIVVVLKGASTLVADAEGGLWKYDGKLMGLATSGSGDVLAGAIAGLAARGIPATQACVWGVVLHALAGRRLRRIHGRLGLLAREIPHQLPAIMNRLSRH